MNAVVTGLDMAEALTTAQAMGGGEADVLADHLVQIETGGLAGFAKQRTE